MKKILLLILFMVLSYLGYSQQRGNVFIVPSWTTNFTMSLPVHTFVYCIDSSKIYRLLAIGQSTKNLSNTVNTVYPAPVTAVLYADSSGVSGFAWKMDTTHNWGYLLADSINVESLDFTSAYGGNIYCDSIWATTHYSVYAYDTVQSVDTIRANIADLNTLVVTPLLSTSDSIAVFSNDTLRYRLAGGISVLYADSSGVSGTSDYSKLIDSTHCYVKLKTDSLSSCSPLVIYSNDTSYYTALGHIFNTDIYMGGYKVLTTTDTTSTLLTQSKATNTYQPIGDYTEFSDTTSTLLTQSKASNTYQLKYWSRTGTAIQPYTATDTVVAPYIRLKNIHTTGTVLTEVTSTGLLDTIATTPISPIYVKKAGDTMSGSLIMNSGSVLFDDYAFASGDKVAVIHESGLLDTATTVTIDNADINTITISDSIRIGGLWYVGDTVIIADEDSVVIPISKSMFGQIWADSSGKFVAYANSFYVDSDGTPHLVANSGRVVASNTDTNVICLYAYAGNLILRNRSGSTMKFKIILNG